MKNGIRNSGWMATGLLVACVAAQPAIAAPGHFELTSPQRFEFSMRDRDDVREEREARKEKRQERKDLRKREQEDEEHGYGYGYERRQPVLPEPRFDRRDRR